MLNVVLVAAPTSDQADAVAGALEGPALAAIYAAPAFQAVAGAIARSRPQVAEAHERFEASESTLAFLTDLAEWNDGTIAVVASVEVVRAVLVHALDAPVPEERLAFDPGAIAEIEVRTDAPWTVNRINDGCHLVP